MLNRRNRRAALIALTLLSLTATSCSFFGGSDDDADKSGKPDATTTDASTPAHLESAEAYGGLDALIAAAQKEGTLTVVGMPSGTAGWGEVIAGFRDKYQIAVNSVNPDSTPAAQLSYAQSIKGQANEPDVFNVDGAFAVDHADALATYQVQASSDVAAEARDAGSRYTGAYAGVMTIGYNSAAAGQLTGLGSIQTAPKGSVALAGEPSDGGTGLAAVLLVNAATGSSLTDTEAGLSFFTTLRQTGVLTVGQPDADAIADGTLTAVFDWSFNQAALAARLAGTSEAGDAEATETPAVTWATFTPPHAAIGTYVGPAISASAQHPAAARLFAEYVLSPEAANLMAAAGARPSLYDALQKAGTLDEAATAGAPTLSSDIVFPTAEQYTAVLTAVRAGW